MNQAKSVKNSTLTLAVSKLLTRDSSGHASNARGSPEEQTLRYAAQLKGLRQLFLHDLDLREITKSDIDECEVELRSIIGGIEQLRKAFTIDAVTTSCDGVETTLWEAINHLYIASDISQKENPTIEERREFYRAFPQCSNLLYFYGKIVTKPLVHIGPNMDVIRTSQESHTRPI